MISSRELIEQLLFADPFRDWSCAEMAKRLRLTGRTISQEIRQLREMDKVERSYGKRRRMTFKAKLSVEYPRWMDRVKLVDLQTMMVVSIHRHTTDGEEW
jgi:DNA-binding transcriptional ArsR family regulator